MLSPQRLLGRAHGKRHCWSGIILGEERKNERRGRQGERGNERLNGLPTGTFGTKNRDRPQISFVR